MPLAKLDCFVACAPRKKVPAKLLISFATNKRNARVALGTFIHQVGPKAGTKLAMTDASLSYFLARKNM
jgi:hypothetical protein